MRVLALLPVSVCVGCAALGTTGVGTSGSEGRVERAVAALEAEDFDQARHDLLALAADCRSGSYGRDAILLLAAAELDTGNPDASPSRAAHLAASYLLLPDASSEGIPMARALYRLGVDRSYPQAERTDPDSLPTVAPRFDACDEDLPVPAPRALPDTPIPRASEIAALRAELAARSDSVDALRGELALRSVEIAELRAEIDRIMDLLKNGMADPTGRSRR